MNRKHFKSVLQFNVAGAAIPMYVFGKLAGFIPYSWWWLALGILFLTVKHEYPDGSAKVYTLFDIFKKSEI